MHRHGLHGRGRRALVGAVLVIGAWLGQAAAVWAEEPAVPAPRATLRLGPVPDYQAGGSLGFRLIDTRVDEQLQRRADGAGQGVVWYAAFSSRWALTDDQLDRWSAQVGGLLADALGTNVRLAAWQRLDASDVGDRRVAYRYTLASATGDRVGDASLVVFARGAEVGLTAVGAVGVASAADAVALARALDGELRETATLASAR